MPGYVGAGALLGLFPRRDDALRLLPQRRQPLGRVFLRRPEGRTLLGGLARVAPRYDGLREPVFPHRRPRFRTGDLFARLLYALQRVAEHGRGRQRAPFLSRVGRIPLSQAPVPHRDLRPQCRGHFEKRFSQNIDPASCFVAQFTPRYETFEVAYNGNPAHRVDIVLLPEGYGAGERAKFEAACREFAREFSVIRLSGNTLRGSISAPCGRRPPIRA